MLQQPEWTKTSTRDTRWGWRTAFHSVIKEGLFGKMTCKLRLNQELTVRKLWGRACQAEGGVNAKALKDLGCWSHERTPVCLKLCKVTVFRKATQERGTDTQKGQSPEHKDGSALIRPEARILFKALSLSFNNVTLSYFSPFFSVPLQSPFQNPSP